jgi:hypothetical protein
VTIPVRILGPGCLLALAAASGVADPDRPAIAALTARVEDGRVHVSYRLQGVFSDELLERIELGLPVGFNHHVSLLQARRFWLDRVVAHVRIDTTVRYDSLTELYELTRRIDGGSELPEEHEQAMTTSSAEAMREWMTALDAFPPLALPTPEPTARLRVRAESVVGRRWYLLLPTKRSVSDERELTPPS